MQISAEVRLWWQDEHREAVEFWFEHLNGIKAGGYPRFDGSDYPKPRRDNYLLELSHSELGIKVRNCGADDERVEVKSLIAQRSEAASLGPVTIWTKTSSTVLHLNNFPMFSVDKWRRLRKFLWSGAILDEITIDKDENPVNAKRPNAGCNLEFTRVAVADLDEVWWTLGYEAFGQLDEVERILSACLLKSTSCKPLPAMDKAILASYPEWLIMLGHSRRGNI